MNILRDLLEDPLKEGPLKASFGGEDLPEDPLQDSLEDPTEDPLKNPLEERAP